MRRDIGCLLGILACAACSDAPFSTNNLTAPTLPGAAPSVSTASPPKNFRAHLSGGEVIRTLPVPTLAQGQVTFQLSPDGTELSHQVIVSNIENVTGAHIHLGAEGARGPLAALLMIPVPPNGGRIDGVLTTGTLTAASLSGPLAGQPLSALIDAIEAGNAYVDIPTNDGVPQIPPFPGTGPGDYPGGELRGQIR